MTLEEVLDQLDMIGDSNEAEAAPVVIRTLDGDVNVANVDWDDKGKRIVFELGAERVP